RREEINRLPEHAPFCFNPAYAPSDDAEPVDHRRMRIVADQRVGEESAVALKNPLREILEVYLMHDTDAGRDEPESFERLLAPFQELVTLAVAFELHLHVQAERFGGPCEIHLHGMIDHEIDRDERLDDFWIAAEFLHRASHRREIDHQRHAGEILENNPRDHEGD